MTSERADLKLVTALCHRDGGQLRRCSRIRLEVDTGLARDTVIDGVAKRHRVDRHGRIHDDGGGGRNGTGECGGISRSQQGGRRGPTAVHVPMSYAVSRPDDDHLRPGNHIEVVPLSVCAPSVP